MSPTIDTRGLTCPAPVLLIKDALERDKPPAMTVLIDNEASLENVSRFLSSRGYAVHHTAREGDYLLSASRDGSVVTATPAADVAPVAPTAGRQKILVLIASDRFGNGDDLLGEKLMVNYLKTIKELGDDLWQVIFINSGVKLTIGSSPVLAELQEYEKNGVIVLACGTCLEHFRLTAAKAVGGSTNMLDIVTASQLADKVVSIG
jgi:selenium metabolism protein YedF